MAIEYNNSAGRILATFEQIVGKGQWDQAAAAFGVANDRSSIMAAVIDLRMEFSSLSDAVEQFSDNPKKYALYKHDLPDIEKSLDSFQLNFPGSFGCNIAPTALVALRYIAADLPEEECATPDEITALIQAINDLQSQIGESQELPKSLRTWLLDLARLMRDGVDRYGIRGGRGLRKQFHTMLGDMMDNYEDIEHVKKTEPKVWSKLCAAMDIMIKVAVFNEKYKPAIAMIRKAIPFWSGDSLPDSDDTQ